MSEHLRSHYRSSPEDLRLVLLGNIGCGKTSSADTILGQLAPGSPSDSKSCQLRKGFSEGRNVTLVEAPRWYWNGGKMEDSVRKETEQAMTLLSPGPHGILLLVPVNQFTEIEGRVPAELEEVFGGQVLDHALVLLTCGDYLMGRSAEEYLQKEHPGLRKMIDRCGGRYHVINNRQRRDREQIRELLEKVDNMVQQNGVYFKKTAEDREFEKQVKEIKREPVESYRAHKEEERETVTSMRIRSTETDSSFHRDNHYSIILERKRREEREKMDERVNESQASYRLRSTPTPEQQSYSETQDDGQLTRTPSFKLNTDGALLSQMCEITSTPKVISTFHHRINSFEERSPEASPTSSLHSPVFSSSSSPSSSSITSTKFSFPSSSSPSSSSSSSPELRLVLLGRSGAGKSAAGNSILGREEFVSHPDRLTSTTQECEKKKALVEGRRVAVVDTPDWFDSERTPDEVRAQISSCVTLSSPGPHAFLMCIPLDRPAKDQLQALRALEVVFGPEAVQKHTLVLFTHADQLRASKKAGDNSIEAYIAGQRADLLKLVEKCGDRFHVMQTGDGRDRRNLLELLEKVEQTVREAGGQCYSCPAFQEAENRVRQRQVEMAKERRAKELEEETLRDTGRLSSERRVTYPYMQTVAEAEEEVREDEIEKTRDEAEMSVSSMNIESLPPVTLSSLSPSFLHSIREKMESNVKMLPQLLADSSVWVSEGARKVQSSPAWDTVSSGAQNIQKMVIDSSAWEKVGASVRHMSKLVGDRVPKVVVDGSALVGSGAKAAAASPMWEKVGSGAKLVANGSLRVGAGIGAGAKNLAQSPVWEKVGSGAKAGAKMVAESSVWEKIGTTAKKVPQVVIGGALLGLVLGVFLGGAIGGAVGAAAGSALTEVGRRRLSNKNMLERTDETARNTERTVNNSMDFLAKQGEKSLKTD